MADFSADATPVNPVLFEEGNWRLYGHLDDEYSTMAHKCPNWVSDGNWVPKPSSGPQWRWFWGGGDCQNCLKPVPDDIKGVWTLHNFDRIAGR